MTTLRLILVAALIGIGVHWWNVHRENRAMRAVTSVNGFVPVPMPQDAKRNTVLLFAPLNCPHEGAQRANALAQGLTERGIPNLRTSQYAAQSFEPDAEQIAAYQRLNAVMTGEIPIALVNGMGKANPTLEEIVAEYQRTQ
jgi:hypothetical protein